MFGIIKTLFTATILRLSPFRRPITNLINCSATQSPYFNLSPITILRDYNALNFPQVKLPLPLIYFALLMSIGISTRNYTFDHGVKKRNSINYIILKK